MDATVRASCPKCGSVLKIPTDWLGQVVKCKKCGSSVRTKAKAASPTPDGHGTAESAALDMTRPAPRMEPQDTGHPASPAKSNDFDFSKAAPAHEPFPLPEPLPLSLQETVDHHPLGDLAGELPDQPVSYPMMPGHPYPLPPGYPPPGGYALPAGYPYPVPPGYPYPVPPGYAPPGYPYHLPTGYVPAGYAPPPGYPYSQPPAMAPADANGAPVAQPLPIAQQPPASHLAPPQDSYSAASAFSSVNHTNSGHEFEAESRTTSRYRRKKGQGQWIAIIACLVITGLLIGCGIYAMKLVNRSGTDKKDRDQAGPEVSAPSVAAVKSGGPFPRRLLFVHMSKYMFLNPLTGTDRSGVDRTLQQARKLASEWRVPDGKDNNQLFVLSDSVMSEKAGESHLPMKNVVTGAFDRFFETSRAQDRIVVYFGGHALEKDGKAYLASVEGDPDEVETLIPLDDFYARLKACKATEKVVIWDVCRFNPERGRLNPGSEPMTESLAKALANAPPGVEVITTCQPGENALEFTNIVVDQEVRPEAFSGSAFLESFRFASRGNHSIKKAGTQSDALPISDWLAPITARLAVMAAVEKDKLKQTPVLEGSPPSSLVAINPDEAPAKRFDMPVPPKGTDPEEIRSIENEYTVPPLDYRRQSQSFAGLPFNPEVMKDYRTIVSINDMQKDREAYRFQLTVLDAIKTVRELWVSGSGADVNKLRESLPGKADDNLKKELFKELEFWALGGAKLTLAAEELKALAPMKDAQSKRWQAHYEYARAVVNTRLAYMNEYNKLLGDVRTDTLPPLDAALKQDQYVLAHSEKMKSKKDVQKFAEDAQEAYNLLITQHKGTPWALQAKEEKNFPLGLYWRPSSSKGDTTIKDIN